MAGLQRRLEGAGVQTDQELGQTGRPGPQVQAPAHHRHLGARILLRLQKSEASLPEGDVEGHQLAESCREARAIQERVNAFFSLILFKLALIAINLII